LRRIYADKRALELKNRGLEQKLEKKVDGTGANDIDFKQKMEVMEHQRIRELKNKKEFD